MTPKWCKTATRLLPWLDGHCDETQRLIDESDSRTAQAEAQAPKIAEQTSYLVDEMVLNGFTRRLNIGMARRTAGE